jgi:hypothetical protein
MSDEVEKISSSLAGNVIISLPTSKQERLVSQTTSTAIDSGILETTNTSRLKLFENEELLLNCSSHPKDQKLMQLKLSILRTSSFHEIESIVKREADHFANSSTLSCELQSPSFLLLVILLIRFLLFKRKLNKI